jgi:hypothetical protein
LWLDRLERRFGKYSIKNLMLYITTLNGVVFILSYLLPDSGILYKLMLEPTLVLKGEVWRLVTFLFIPMNSSPIWILFTLYFYYLIGSSLENEWGSFKFNLYYLIGVLGTIAGAFLGGAGTAEYLNLSLIFAFAFLFPNYELMLFFFIPVKIKYLAIVYAALLVLNFSFSPLYGLITVLGSALNFIIFFWKDVYYKLRFRQKAQKNKQEFKAKIPKIHVMHRCTVCGKTDVEDRKMDFRYCMDCEGDYEYCMDHLYNHEHIKKGQPDKQGNGESQ